MSLTLVIVLGLAAHRLWRLVAVDEITEPLRARLFRTTQVGAAVHVGRHQRVRLWLLCPWCSGFWIALAGYVAWHEWPTGSAWAIYPLAASSIAGLVVRNLDPVED